MGLTDHVVLGAGLGAGFGLLESVVRYGLDADRAIGVPAGGWIIPDSLSGTPYVPGLEQLVVAWFPAPVGTLGMGDHTPTVGTSPHLAQTVLAALGVALLLRGRRWTRLLGIAPVAAAVAQHIIINYAAIHPTDQDARSRADLLDGLLWTVPLACLAIAVIVDMRQLRRGKAAVPGVLSRGEQAGGSGTASLAAYGGWRVPWATLIAVRFARLRRSSSTPRLAVRIPAGSRCTARWRRSRPGSMPLITRRRGGTSRGALCARMRARAGTVAAGCSC
ncbi:hypothetical protein NKH77_46840 [Streptomyces sp. M19]